MSLSHSEYIQRPIYNFSFPLPPSSVSLTISYFPYFDLPLTEYLVMILYSKPNGKRRTEFATNDNQKTGLNQDKMDSCSNGGLQTEGNKKLENEGKD